MAARRQFLNDPGTLVAQALEGLERSNSDIVRWNRQPSFVVRADDDQRPRVAIVSGGGSGHVPLHTGFVGRGMLDAAVPGAIFASPSMIQVKAATEAVDRGLGVVHVVKNYTGDVINFGLARDLAIEEGLAVETVIVDDDLATDGSPDDGPGWRGTLGEAVEVANDSRYGLSAYIFSRDYETMTDTVDALRFGEIYINRTLGESVHAHHSGYGDSGIGGEDGKWGLLRYTQIKTTHQRDGGR